LKTKAKDAAPINIEDMSGWKLSQIFEAMEACGKYTKHTNITCRSALKRFIAFHGADIKAEEVTFAMLEEFRLHREKSVKAKTANYDVDMVSAIVKFANPKLLKERFRGNTRKLHHIRIDIADSASAKHPRRLEKLIALLLEEIDAT
jgi:hypothetical protein